MANLDPTIIVMIVAGLAGVFVLAVLMQVNSAHEAKRIKGRLERTRSKRSAVVGGGMASVRLTHGDSRFAAIDEFVRRYMPQPAKLRERLDRTGLQPVHRPARGVRRRLGHRRDHRRVAGPRTSRAWCLVLIFILSSTLLPHFVIAILIKRRINRFLGEFPEALDLIIRGLKSGLPVPESIRNVGEEFDGPVGQEFHVVTDKIKLGQPLEDALWDATRRVDIQDFKFFVISLAVQRETGGNLAETLENLVDILRRRRQMKLKIKAMSSEAKASAIILGSLPFIMFGILLLLNPEYMGTLLHDPRGMVMIGVGLGIIGFGALVLKKMVSFEI